jgi:uncharacterized protein (DUF1501 family)
MYRRELLKLGGVSVAGLFAAPFLPVSLSAADPKKDGKEEGSASLNYDRTLVLIELRGGNDGLNTVVPFADPEYYKLRKSVGIPEVELVKLDKQFGFHPALKPLEGAWKDGDLAIVHGLGYPNPNRSHFRGIDIWNGGTKNDELARDGWLGRIVAQARSGAPSECLADGIMLGYAESVAYGGAGPMFANGLRTITMDGPEDFIRRAKRIPKPGEGAGNPALAHVLKVQADVNETADRMETLWRKAANLPGQFPGGLGAHLKVAARLIASGALCPFYKVTIAGFDTHAGQKTAHQNLLTTLGQAMAAFREALKSVPGAWERTLVMTYSEFGRTASENDSGGTDHGTAAPHLLMGGKVKGGHQGKPVSLTELEYGDLRYTTDYRSLYSAVAQNWFGYTKPFLSEKKIQPLQGLFTA